MIRRLTIWPAQRVVPRNEAVRYWRESHVPLVLAVPGVRRYTQSPCVPGPGESESTYAGLGELWFDSVDVAVAAQNTPQWRRVVEDAATFMDLDRLTIAWTAERTTP